MNVPATLHSLLTPLVGGDGRRVAPFPAPQDTPLPRITWQGIAGTHPFTLNQTPGIGRQRWQVDIWAPRYGDALDLAEQAQSAILASGLNVTELTTNPEDYELDTRLYRQSFDIAVWQ